MPTYVDEEKKIFMYNMYVREELISTLPKIEFVEVKILQLAYEVLDRLESLY